MTARLAVRDNRPDPVGSFRACHRSLVCRVYILDQLGGVFLGGFASFGGTDLADLAAVHTAMFGADLVLENIAAVFLCRSSRPSG